VGPFPVLAHETAPAAGLSASKWG